MRVPLSRCILAVLALFLITTVPLAAQTGSVSGMATNPRTNIPAAGARVEAVARSGRVVGVATTDAAGRFQLRGLPTGTYVVRVTPETGAPYQLGEARVVAGQTATLTTDPTALAVDLDPIVVTASKRAEKAVNAPARVEVVGEQAIAAQPAVSPVEHLRAIPGIDVASTGLQSSNVVARGFNNIFSGSLHALTDNRIAGVPSLRVNMMQLVPATNEDIQRMEVVLGPGAALYGPNTANGILHIITKSPLADQGTTVTAAGGSRDVFHGTFRTAQLLGENLGIKLSGQYLRGDEWEYSDRAEVNEAAKFANPATGPFFKADLMRAAGINAAQADQRIARIGERDFGVERWAGEARADWRVTPDFTTIFSIGSATQLSGVELTGLGAAQVQDWRYTYYQARGTWNRLFGQVYLNTSDAGDTYLLRNGAPIVDRSKLLVGQLQHGFTLRDRQSFTYGVDYAHTMPDTEGTINGIYEADDETREFGAYVQSETALTPKLDLVLAGRVDTHSALPEAIFSPRAAVVFKPALNQAFRVSYNRAFSTPSSLNQFLDLGSPIPDPGAARLGYSLRIQGTGDTGFRFRQADGSYLMRSPFTPQAAGGPATLVPANAAAYFPAAVAALARGAAAGGRPLPADLVAYLSSLRPTAAQIGTNFVLPGTTNAGTLSELNLPDVDPIRESISNTLEVGYKGILGQRLLLAADVWYSQRNNLVTPLTIQTPLLLLNGQQTAAYLVGRFMTDLRLPQAQAVALATQLVGSATTPGLATIPVGVISSADVNANGAQLLVTYTNVDEQIELWGSDISATALITNQWSVSATASFVNDDQFAYDLGGQPQVVTLNAPKSKGSIAAAYQNDAIGFNGEARVRYTAGFPVNSGVYIGTRCLPTANQNDPLLEDCVEDSTLVDLTLGYRVPRFRQASLQLSVQNLLDEEYRSFPGTPTIGRMALLRLKYEF